MAGLFGAFSANKSNQKSSFNENFSGTSTTNAINPDWVQNPLKDFTGQVGALGGANPYSFTPGASDLQSQAFGTVKGLIGSSNPYRDGAMGALSAANNAQTAYVTPQGIDPAQTYSGETAYGGINNYLNPFLSEVVDATAADINHQAAIADQRAKSAATSAGAWSGDGAEVLRGVTAGNYSRDLATTIANLRAGGFNTALGAAQQDAGRAQAASADNASAANQRAMQEAQFRQQAEVANQASNNAVRDRYLASAGLLGSMGQQASNEQMGQLGLLADLGGVQRGIESEYAQSPLNLMQLQAGLFGSLPFDLFRGETTDESGNKSGTSKTSGTSVGVTAGWGGK